MSDTTTPLPPEIFGPYSAWPRRKPSRRARAALALGAAAAAVAAHCALPLI